MKKIYSILMLAMMAMCVLTISSCGDDDDEFSYKSIIGTWRCTETDGNAKYIDDVTFKTDNTFLWREIEYKNGKIVNDDKYSGKYYINGTNILLEFSEDDSETWEVMYIDGKQMRVRWNDSEDFYTLYKV